MPTHFGVSILLLHGAIFRKLCPPLGLRQLVCWQQWGHAVPQPTVREGTTSHLAHCAWMKHAQPEAEATLCNELPLNLVFALMVSKPWVIFQMLMCCITSSQVFKVVPPSPSAAYLARRSAISHHVLGHWAPWGKGLCLCTISEMGAVSRAPRQAAGACVGSAHTPVSALSVWGPGGGGRVFLCWS